ncbi:hypothetical protein ACI7RC_20345 [Brevibacillus sp. B_LB10_24]|uniref:hypothetical protein n=1 Tax=Brevibacillus sp. B_LB10_24 TaxID=3380645 RepID=UPI0038B75518
MGKRKHFSELRTVESTRNEVAREEFPEGPYGASTNEIRLGKATGWEEGQYSSPTQFGYENRELHEDLSRQFPGSHPANDQPEMPDDY